MPFPHRIELSSGADRALRAANWLAWMAAAVSMAVHSPRFPGWLLVLGGVLLIGSFPGRPGSVALPRRLILHADGRAQWGDLPGAWLPGTWRIRRYSVIRFQSSGTVRFIWISACKNHPDDWRHLTVWSRFPPQADA